MPFFGAMRCARAHPSNIACPFHAKGAYTYRSSCTLSFFVRLVVAVERVASDSCGANLLSPHHSKRSIEPLLHGDLMWSYLEDPRQRPANMAAERDVVMGGTRRRVMETPTVAYTAAAAAVPIPPEPPDSTGLTPRAFSQGTGDGAGGGGLLTTGYAEFICRKTGRTTRTRTLYHGVAAS